MAKEFITMTLREKDYTFRALDLDQFEALEQQFGTVTAAANTGGAMPKEALQATAEIAHTSLQYRHPEITVADVRKLITLGTVGAVLSAVRGVSQIEPGGAIGTGEAEAGSV